IEHGEFTGDISVLSLARLPAGLRAGVQGALKAVRRWSYELARFVIAPSSALAREAEGFGFPRDAIHIVPNPVDTTRFRPAEPGQRAQLRQALGLSEESEVVVYTGRLVRGKGLLTLVAAWEQVAAARSRALLVLVGEGVSDSPLDAEEDIRRAVHSAGLQSRVRFEGNRDDVERYLQAGDLYAFPSEAEGFGNALVEALACGLAVVCSRIEGASADLVVEGQHGLKFEVSD